MPYFITDKNADCSGWSVVDDAGEAYGCHTTKQDAIDQAIAISLSDDEPFEGERAAVGSLAVDDYVSWDVLDPEIVAQVVAVEKDVAVVRIFEEDDGIFEATDKLMIMNVFKLEKIPAPEMLAVEIEDPEEMPTPMVEPMPIERWKSAAERIVSKLEQGDNVLENRTKWVSAAWAIKAAIEDGTTEARDLGKSEKRVHVTDLEVREDGDGMTFEGYAAVFNSDSEPLPFIERIQPGAFRKSLQSRNEIKLLWNHDAGEPLASVRGGTLKLSEDATGLRAWARIANTTRGRDVAELIRSGTIDSMSFGFNVIKDSWSDDGNVRTLEQVRVFEISLVAFPAYTATAGTVSVREQRNIDADKLADSLARLESGDELDGDQADLIKNVVDKLTNKPEPTEDATPDNGLGLLEIQQLKLKLLEKGI